MRIFLKSLLFMALMNFAPSLYIIFVAGGLLPPIFYLYFILGSSEQVVITMWLVHLIIYSVIFFSISSFFVKFVYNKYEPNKIKVIISSAIIGLALLSFIPIYNIGGHSSSKTTNIIGVYESADRVSYLPW